MKTKFFTTILILLVSAFAFTGCNKNDDGAFDYPMETLYGTWDGTAIYLDNEWVDITRYPFNEFAFSIKFYSDGTYYGSGAFGNGGGTYEASGNTVKTIIDGEEYARYVIISMNNSTAELTMHMGGKSLPLRVKKR